MKNYDGSSDMEAWKAYAKHQLRPDPDPDMIQRVVNALMAERKTE